MDSKNQENYIKKYDEKSLDKLHSRLVFNDPAHLFIFKKTEKVAVALHLITNLISDNEPIKWQIRQMSLRVLSDTVSLKRTSPSRSKVAINDLLAYMSELVSLMKVASLSNHVSSMNYSVMHKEILMLMNNLDALNLETLSSGGYVLPQDFFNVPEPTFSTLTSNKATNATQLFSKGHYRTSVDVKDNQLKQSESIIKDSIKDNRRETIIRLLKVHKYLGIKEFALEIRGCSEKTIQRELIDMVGKGVLKKTGERRWSTYSLIT